MRSGSGSSRSCSGQAPGGTLQAFYPALDLALLALLALWVRGLVRLVRAPLVTVGAVGAVRSTPSSPGPVRFVATRARWLGGRALRVYLDVLVPVVILFRAPDLFGAGWPVLVRIDVGLVLAGLVAIRLLDGAIRIVRHVQAGGMTGLRLGRPGIAGDGSIPLAIDR